MPEAHPSVVARVRTLVEHPAEADQLLEVWLRRFGAVADRALRRTVLAQNLAEIDDGSLIGLLVRLEVRAAQGDATCRWLAAELALTPSILQELPYERMAELYVGARAADQDRVAARFLGAHAAAVPIEPRNPHLDATPGARTAAARGTDRLVLDRLMHDRDPRVIAALLDNPRITERDVVRIAAMRPTAGTILAAIAAHPRWGQRYRVRKAVAFNPATPVTLARPLLPTLLRQHLEELADSRVLPDLLRDDVHVLLRRASGRGNAE
jgi:hypothetical protein